jgi:hypothetical protein
MAVGGKHRRTLAAVFAEPTRANVAWKDVEALLATLGAELTEGSGSRVRAHLVRLPPDLHREIYVRARAEGKSLNRWIGERLKRAV